MLRVAFVVSSFVSFASVAAQAVPAPELRVVGPSAEPEARYALHWPAGSARDAWLPVAVVLARDALDAPSPPAVALASAGFVVVRPDAASTVAALAKVLTDVRRTVRVDQGGLHAVVVDEAGLRSVVAAREEFQTITAHRAAAAADASAVERLPARRFRVVVEDDVDVLARVVRAQHDARALGGVAGEVARVLDVFHDAAARADEDAYFAILPDDAVFLGTDGTERWTGAQFRTQMTKYFVDRATAWTYVTLARHVDVEPGDTIAWFDETFDNAAYGECRGTGVLAKRDGRWVLRQYHLTVPVPNDLARDVAACIREFQEGRPAYVRARMERARPGREVAAAAERDAAAMPKTVVLVRHAEKADASADSQLSDAGRARAEALAKHLRDVPFTSVFTSEYARTSATVAPLCTAKSLERHPVPAAQTKALLAKLAAEPAGSHVLVCGHSNTVPEILQALGVREPVRIADDEYDRLFVVTLGAGGPRLLQLRY